MLHAREAAKLFLDERILHQRIKLSPQFRGVSDHAEVGFPREGVERAVAVGEQVDHLGARVLVGELNGVAQAAGGGVVAITKSSGQNEDFFHNLRNANTFMPN